MSDKKPTRKEAMEAGRKVWCSGPAIPEDIVDAVAALFGGFAPSVVEVPEVELMDYSGAYIVAAKNRPLGYCPEVRRQQILAIAARSNAWEEIASSLERYAEEFRRWDLSGEASIRGLVNLMRRPEMGIGPKGKS